VTDPGSIGDTGQVIRVDPATGAQTLVATGDQLIDPFGIALDPTGRIFVTDGGTFEEGGRVIAIDPATGTQTLISSGGGLVTPFDLVLVPEPVALGLLPCLGGLLLRRRRS
jgi:DNA-binding beta-propeller fold protein YncE